MPPIDIHGQNSRSNVVQTFDNYWLEYYRPLALSSFSKMFSYRMNSTLFYIPSKPTQEGKYDLSPFKVRAGQEHEAPERSRRRKGVTILDPADDQKNAEPIYEKSELQPISEKQLGWLQQPQMRTNISKDRQGDFMDALKTSQSTPGTGKTFKDKTAMTQWTLNQFVVNSLNPTVTTNEMDEYDRYISHPLNLPLVVSSETPLNTSLDFLHYVQSLTPELLQNMSSTDEDVAEFSSYLVVEDDPLTVTDADTPKKRYKAYRQWLKGKSLFKQSRTDN